MVELSKQTGYIYICYITYTEETAFLTPHERQDYGASLSTGKVFFTERAPQA